LHILCKHQSQQHIETFLNQFPSFNLEARNKVGVTPLYALGKYNSECFESAKYMIEQKGASVKVIVNETNMLNQALERNDVKAVEYLMEHRDVKWLMNPPLKESAIMGIDALDYWERNLATPKITCQNHSDFPEFANETFHTPFEQAIRLHRYYAIDKLYSLDV